MDFAWLLRNNLDSFTCEAETSCTYYRPCTVCSWISQLWTDIHCLIVSKRTILLGYIFIFTNSHSHTQLTLWNNFSTLKTQSCRRHLNTETRFNRYKIYSFTFSHSFSLCEQVHKDKLIMREFSNTLGCFSPQSLISVFLFSLAGKLALPSSFCFVSLSTIVFYFPFDLFIIILWFI